MKVNLYLVMSRKRDELIKEIENWKPKIAKDNDFLEIAFFKIFVKFENFLTDIIVDYATGAVVNEDKVKLRISFEDREHFKSVTGLDHLDINNKTKKLVEHIFSDDNKISFFFNSSHATFFEDMKSLRNYIAHESQESRTKYIRRTLNNYPGSGSDFVEPNVFLQWKKRSERDSIYTKFIELVLTYSESIDYDS